jgi:hypothetical protein
MVTDRQLWNRDELYGEVWSTPMKTLAQKYGISDVGLAKVCRKLAIPVPGRGHWAKKEAGHDVKPLTLPPLKEKVVLWKPTPRPEPPKLSDSATAPELAQVEQLEKVIGEVALKRGSLSHPLIDQARSLLGKCHADDRPILWTPEPCLDIRVSKASLDRALRITAGLISVIEDAGYSVSVETRDRKHQTLARIHGEEIQFGVVEKVDRVEITTPPKGGLLERVLTFAGKPVTYEPSGKLSIIVWSAWGSDRKKWTDRKSRIEEQLCQIAAGFIRLALADRAEKEKRAAAERERQRIAQEHAQLEGLIKTEKSRVRALGQAAARWSRAHQIRSFISAARDAAIQNGQSVEAGSPFGDWIAWAERQADRMDPLKESPPSIIDRMAEREPSSPSYYGYGYQKPDPPFRFPKPIWRMTR